MKHRRRTLTRRFAPLFRTDPIPIASPCLTNSIFRTAFSPSRHSPVCFGSVRNAMLGARCNKCHNDQTIFKDRSRRTGAGNAKRKSRSLNAIRQKRFSKALPTAVGRSRDISDSVITVFSLQIPDPIRWRTGYEQPGIASNMGVHRLHSFALTWSNPPGWKPTDLAFVGSVASPVVVVPQ